MLEGVAVLEESTLVQSSHRILQRTEGTEQQVTQHRAIGHAVHFGQQHGGELLLPSLTGVLVGGLGYQRGQRMEVLTTSLHTFDDRLLLARGQVLIQQSLTQGSDSILVHRLLHLGFIGSQRTLVVLLVGLDTQAFSHTQLEHVQVRLVVVSPANYGFSTLLADNKTMNLAGLRVDGRIQTHTIVLPGTRH